MQKKLFSNLAFVLLVNAFIKPLWIFGIDRSFQNIVGSEEYGTYFSLFSLSVVASFLLDLGITNFNNRNIAQHAFLLPKYLHHLFSIKTILSFTYLLLLMGIGLLLAYNGRELKLLLWLGVNQVLNSTILYFRSNISALQRFKLDSFFSVLDKSLMILFVGFVLFFLSRSKLNVERFIALQTIAYVIVFIAIGFLNYRITRQRIKFFFRANFAYNILRKSYPYALLALLVGLYLRSDSIMIERLLDNGKEQAGIYAQSFRIVDALAIIGYLIAGILLPLMSKQIKNKEDVQHTLVSTAKWFISFAFLVAVNGVFFSNNIIHALYDDGSFYSSIIFSILICTFVPVACYYTFSTFLTANGNIYLLNKISAFGLLLNIALNYYFILHYEAIGAAISSLLTQLLTTVLQIFVRKKLSLSFNFRYLLRVIAFVLIIFLIFYLEKKLTLDNIKWQFMLALNIMLGTLFLWLLKLIELRFLKEGMIKKIGKG